MTNRVGAVLFLRSAEYSVVIYGNHSDLTVASSQCDILLCSETLVSAMRHVMVPGFGRPGLLCRGRMPGAVEWVHTCEIVDHFANTNLGVAYCEMLIFGAYGSRQNFYVFIIYRYTDLDGLSAFLFVGDLNGNHQEWLGSTTTNRHGVAALNFTTITGSDQLVDGPPMNVVKHMISC